MGVADISCSAILMLAMYLRSDRAAIAGMVLVFFLGHLIACDYITYIDGFYYYASAGLTEAAIIIILLKVEYKTALIVDIRRILFAMFIINFAGWIMYESSMEPTLYSLMMAITYLILVIRLMVKTGRDRGDRRLKTSFWGVMVRDSYYQIRHSVTKGRTRL